MRSDRSRSFEISLVEKEIRIKIARRKRETERGEERKEKARKKREEEEKSKRKEREYKEKMEEEGVKNEKKARNETREDGSFPLNWFEKDGSD